MYVCMYMYVPEPTPCVNAYGSGVPTYRSIRVWLENLGAVHHIVERSRACVCSRVSNTRRHSTAEETTLRGD
jgi:hypothetical protein